MVACISYSTRVRWARRQRRDPDNSSAGPSTALTFSSRYPRAASRSSSFFFLLFLLLSVCVATAATTPTGLHRFKAKLRLRAAASLLEGSREIAIRPLLPSSEVNTVGQAPWTILGRPWIDSRWISNDLAVRMVKSREALSSSSSL